MSADAYEQAAAILDAAAAGERLAGFDALGGLLIDLRSTHPVPPGAAIRSSAVSVATAATTPGRLAAVAALVKPGLVVLGLTSLAFAVGLSVNSGSSTEVVPPGPDPTGVERVVGALDDEPANAPDGRGRSDADGTDADNADGTDADGSPTVPSPAGALPGSGGTPSTEAPSSSPSPAPPSTTAPAPVTTEAPSTTAAPSTTQPPTSSAAPPPTTVSPTTSTPEEQGNNGNDNGNGVGNGKGNNGKGGGKASGGPPDGDDG